MKEKYYAGDRELKPCLCHKLSVTDSRPGLDFAILDLERGNIRWTIWTGENGKKQMVFVLYRDRKGLVLRTK